MTGLVSSHQLGAFAVPVNATVADADVVRGNDNDIASAHNEHDADSSIHPQSGLLADRPAASLIGSLYVSTDGRRFYLDNGTTWAEVAYVPAVGGLVGDGTAYPVAGYPVLGANSVFSSADNTYHVGTNAYVKQTAAAAAGGPQGTSGVAECAHTSGTVALAIGANATIRVSGIGGTTTEAKALCASAVLSAGTVTAYKGVSVLTPGSGATIDTVYGVHVADLGAVGTTRYAFFSAGSAASQLGGPLAVNGATPHAAVTITGSRGGNAALASLLTELAALGLIVDGSSA
jgi:hypothetical protein